MKLFLVTLILAVFTFFFNSYAANAVNWIDPVNIKLSPRAKIVNSKERSYFYNMPDKCCANNKIFLVQGDHISSWLTYKGYDYIYYNQKNGNLVSGWMLSVKLKDAGALTTIPLESDEFFVVSKWGKIQLDSPYQDFYNLAGKEEVNSDSIGFMDDNFITVGSHTYKYFQHNFKNIDLISSNINYLSKKRDFDDYRITKLIINGEGFITGRGIHVGSDENDIKKAYGNPIGKNDLSWKYFYKDMSIAFNLNKLNKVETIELSVIPE